MRLFLILCLLVLATASPAATTADALREMIYRGDIPAVAAALKQAHDEDLTEDDELYRQRALFAIFTETHPKVGAFTEAWLAQSPDDPYAMTARGWQLYATGWALRGQEYVNIYPEAMPVVYQRHDLAFDLMAQAITLQPDLFAASDGILRLTATLGNQDVIPVELDRVMALRPNRGSLMLGMVALAPQWGGNDAQVRDLCADFAGKITSVPDYDAATCKIDAAYFAGFCPCERSETAHQLLMLNQNPILDYARLIDATKGRGTPQWRMKILNKAKAARQLTTDEALSYDSTMAELKGPGVLVDNVEFRSAVRNNLDAYRLRADRDPLNPLIVDAYIDLAQDNEAFNAIPPDPADLTGRAKTLLAEMPYDSTAWLTLASAMTGEGSLDQIKAAEPYYINAVVYSNYDWQALLAMVKAKAGVIVDPQNILQAKDIATLSPGELAKLDEIVHCPLMRQWTLLRASCQQVGLSDDRCATPELRLGAVMSRLQETVARGVCPEIANGDLQSYLYQPVKIDF